MNAEREAGSGGEADGPRVVGVEYPGADDSSPRRDRPAPAPWTREVPPGDLPDDYVARPVPSRPMSIGRLLVVTLIAAFLVGMVIDFIATLRRGDEVPAGMALGLVYGAAIQVLGWWTVIHLIRRR